MVERPPRLRTPDPNRLPVQRPMREGDVPEWHKNPLAFDAARASAWVKSLDYWDGFVEHGTPTNAIASIIAADLAGCYPPPVAQEWLIRCLRRWNRSFAEGKPLSLDQALGLAAQGRGGEPDAARVERLNRNQYLAYHMATLIALGVSAAHAAKMLAPTAAEGRHRHPHIDTPGIIRAWPQWKRDYAGWLPLATMEAHGWSAAERERYLSQYSVRPREQRKPRDK